MSMRIAVVGVCAAGKTTLVNGLKKSGLDAVNVPQEHSCVKMLWKKHSPDILVMLDAKLATIRKRRTVPWGEERLKIQHERLRTAREQADLYIETDGLTIEEVLRRVVDYARGKDGVNDHCQ